MVKLLQGRERFKEPVPLPQSVVQPFIISMMVVNMFLFNDEICHTRFVVQDYFLTTGRPFLEHNPIVHVEDRVVVLIF